MSATFAKLKSLLCLAIGFFAALGVLSVTQGHTAQASTSPGVNLAALLAEVNTLRNNQQADEATIASQASTISALQTKTAPLSVSGTTLTISGVNVHIIDGTGSTNSTSGLGNLTIGYNVSRSSGDVRTGSHNLILGDQNNYSSYGGLVAGSGNTISANYASVTGGGNNTASYPDTSVSGGYGNVASNFYASVSGGGNNTQSTDEGWSGGPLSQVSGTDFNCTGVNVHIVDGTGATNSTSGLGNLTIGYNILRGSGSDIRTGSHNLILGDYNNYSSYGGLVAGYENTISNTYATITGGNYNIANAQYATVSGGGANTASGYAASVIGGGDNTASYPYASVSGGYGSTARGDYASISGGINIGQGNEYGWSAGSQGSPAVHGNFTSP